MTAATSADSRGTAAGPPLDRSAAELRRWSVGTLIGLLVITAALVAWRRLAGALHNPLPPLLLLSVAGPVAAVSVGARLIWHHLPSAYRPPWLDRLVVLVPSAVVLVLGAALSLRGTAVGGLLAFWGPVVVGELWAWWLAVGRARPEQHPAPRPSRPIRTDPPQAFSPHPSRHAAPDEVPAENVLQQLTRSRTDDGSEQLSGWLRMPFTAGQRTANVHVAFCPPFSRTPELSVEQLDGPPTRIKTAQLLPHGARFDLKLGTAAEKPEAVLLQFSARSQPAG